MAAYCFLLAANPKEVSQLVVKRKQYSYHLPKVQALVKKNPVPFLCKKTDKKLPWSFPKATSEPVKVTPPMKVPRKRNVLITLAAGSVAKWGCSRM